MNASRRVATIASRAASLLVIAAATVLAATADADTAHPVYLRLANLSSSDRENARIALELPASVEDEGLKPRARLVAQRWHVGEYQQALESLAELLASEGRTALALNWLQPRPNMPAIADRNVPVAGPAAAGFDRAELAVNPANGDLIALLVDDEAGWSIHRSTDRGDTWRETATWSSAVGVRAADLAAGGNQVWIAYVDAANPTEARLRRLPLPTANTPEPDAVTVVRDVSPATVTELALASNLEGPDDLLTYTLLTNTRELAVLLTPTADAPAFVDRSPPFSDVAGRLDADWNHGFIQFPLFLSYVSTAETIVMAWTDLESPPFWSAADVEPGVPQSVTTTALAAAEGAVLVAFEKTLPVGVAISYVVTYDEAASFVFGNLAVPQSREGPYSTPAVTARGGGGFGAVFTQESGDPDDVFLRYRRTYAFAPWSNAFRLDTVDASTTTPLTINVILDEPRGVVRYACLYLSNGGQVYASHFQWPLILDCLAGPEILFSPPGCPAADFVSTDYDEDRDVDLHDAAIIQAAFN